MSGSGLRVLHTAHSMAPEGRGGVEAYLAEILPAQHRAGLDVRMFVGTIEHWPEFGFEDLDVEGVQVRRVHRDDYFFDHYAKQWHPQVARLFRETLRAWQPDVVHVHQWLRLGSELCAIASEEGIPVVLTLHDLYSSCPRCFRVRPGEEHCERRLSIESCLDCVPRYGHESERELRHSIELYRDHSRAEIASARSVLVASEATRDLIAHGLEIDPERFELLPLAYEPRFESLTIPESPQDGPIRFAYWGNLTYRKGIPVLLEAFQQVVARTGSDRVELHLFGRVDTDELQAQLEHLADGYPVFFHGRYEYGELAGAGLHVAVFPMVCFETWGFVLDEAFELGLPVVLTDLGAMPERLGEAGLAVPPRDASALAEAMLRLFGEPETRRAMRASIRRSAPSGRSGLLEHLRRLESVYTRAVTAGPNTPVRVEPGSFERLVWLQRESAQLRAGGEPG